MLKRLFGLFALTGIFLVGYMYIVATSDPVIRESSVTVSSWPQNQPSLKLLLVSDIHVAGPDMPPDRLERIVEQMNALNPDIVAFAGDFVSDKRTATKSYSTSQSLKPLTGLKTKYGIYAVLGNHDHWRDASAISDALDEAGIILLTNGATQVGHLSLGGIDDDFTGRADVPKVLSEMASMTGFPVFLSHSPDIVPELPDQESLIVAGHTHCGQIVLPWIGAIATMSEFGDRFACGEIREGKKTIVVGAGLGTSILPLRLGAVPDMWLIEIGP